MRHLEDSVRAAVEDLAATAPYPRDLATLARIKGTRIRRRRRAAVTAAAVVLAGAALAPFTLLQRRDAAPHPAPAASASASSAPASARAGAPIPTQWWKAPVELPGDVVVTELFNSGTQIDENGQDIPWPQTLQGGNVVLDPTTRRYQVVRGDLPIYSPNGKFALLSADDNKLRIRETATGKVRRLGHGGSGEWSPDGARLAITGINRFWIVDAKTGAQRLHDDLPGIDRCPDTCTFTWLPNGKEVALGQTDPAIAQSESRPDTVNEIAIYSAETGKLLRRIPVPGVPASSASWSPDGRHVLLLPDTFDEPRIRIAEVATGRIVGTLAEHDARFVAPGRILALGRAANLYDVSGALLETVRLPQDFTSRRINVGRR